MNFQRDPTQSFKIVYYKLKIIIKHVFHEYQKFNHSL